MPQTRWHATDTTLGPRWKVSITAALLVPLLLMILQLRHASQDPRFAFLMVPIGGLGIFAAQFLPYVWEPGRLRTSNAARDRAAADPIAGSGGGLPRTPDSVPTVR
jgi:hypothetical protein